MLKNYNYNTVIKVHVLYCSLTLDEQPVVDHSLNVGVEKSGDVVTHLQVGDVDEGAGGGSQRFLTQDAHDQLPVLHYDLCE